jgi:hypothetical protein
MGTMIRSAIVRIAYKATRPLASSRPRLRYRIRFAWHSLCGRLHNDVGAAPLMQRGGLCCPATRNWDVGLAFTWKAFTLDLRYYGTTSAGEIAASSAAIKRRRQALQMSPPRTRSVLVPAGAAQPSSPSCPSRRLSPISNRVRFGATSLFGRRNERHVAHLKEAVVRLEFDAAAVKDAQRRAMPD